MLKKGAVEKASAELSRLSRRNCADVCHAENIIAVVIPTLPYCHITTSQCTTKISFLAPSRRRRKLANGAINHQQETTPFVNSLQARKPGTPGHSSSSTPYQILHNAKLQNLSSECTTKIRYNPDPDLVSRFETPTSDRNLDGERLKKRTKVVPKPKSRVEKRSKRSSLSAPERNTASIRAAKSRSIRARKQARLGREDDWFAGLIRRHGGNNISEAQIQAVLRQADDDANQVANRVAAAPLSIVSPGTGSGIRLVSSTGTAISVNIADATQQTYTIVMPPNAPSAAGQALNANLDVPSTATATASLTGIDSNTVWHTVPTNTAAYSWNWYGGATLAATLTGAGALTTIGALSAPSAAISGNVQLSGGGALSINSTAAVQCTMLNPTLASSGNRIGPAFDWPFVRSGTRRIAVSGSARVRRSPQSSILRWTMRTVAGYLQRSAGWVRSGCLGSVGPERVQDPTRSISAFVLYQYSPKRDLRDRRKLPRYPKHQSIYFNIVRFRASLRGNRLRPAAEEQVPSLECHVPLIFILERKPTRLLLSASSLRSSNAFSCATKSISLSTAAKITFSPFTRLDLPHRQFPYFYQVQNLSQGPTTRAANSPGGPRITPQQADICDSARARKQQVAVLGSPPTTTWIVGSFTVVGVSLFGNHGMSSEIKKSLHSLERSADSDWFTCSQERKTG
ncbi:uncharacterized protein EV422DRAFT_510358 [Fimicolochytrium jonesii]|uniref:uncharacterized protein n=1 Tax=Fimicolochytrium jonesii TaxID=1396493 RepID=UPI0022FDC6E5|nr:uncharacterized protein EV422DRAFT_510358 [Fimicolochytrium jonesii]KAI8815695.1 hypothetical protein EV422DRAFT_510358 [Fimicolochytrium jonesii]